MRSKATQRPLRAYRLLAVGCAFLAALPATATEDAPAFREVALESGLAFTHFNGMSGEFYFPEMTGQGGGVFDYDADGDLDVFPGQASMTRQILARARWPEGDFVGTRLMVSFPVWGAQALINFHFPDPDEPTNGDSV
ncbi:MAG: hypothetical protein QF819_06485 [Gemmatimonadota bacterium]|nr:hypothetical protein [Gemmatimonadota bacterium]MDP6802805.1 hypothetical protein [Gemmatimonadota bacterium]MDP7031018.1 hypothetical protein [Gemmatimonadota bacterium]